MNGPGRVRQGLARLMMIGNDQFEAQALGLLGLFEAGDATVHRDHHLGAAGRDLPEGFAVQAVTFLQAMGNVEVRLASQKPESLEKNGAAGDAVNVVVAVYANPAIVL